MKINGKRAQVKDKEILLKDVRDLPPTLIPEQLLQPSLKLQCQCPDLLSGTAAQPDSLEDQACNPWATLKVSECQKIHWRNQLSPSSEAASLEPIITSEKDRNADLKKRVFLETWTFESQQVSDPVLQTQILVTSKTSRLNTVILNPVEKKSLLNNTITSPRGISMPK